MTNQTQIHSHFNHNRVGLQHLIVQARKKINQHRQQINDVDLQTVAVEREFQKHASIHSIWYRNVDGFETATYPVESQMESARHYFGGMVGGVVVAIVFGVYFSVTTLVAHSFWTLLAGSIVVAVLIGVLASIILRSLLNASAVNPKAIKHVNLTLAVSGIFFFVLLGLFAWLRFNSFSPLAGHLPAIMVGIELSALVFAGACDCGYRMYRWSGKLNNKHRHLLNLKASLEDELAEEHLALEELEHRLHPARHAEHLAVNDQKSEDADLSHPHEHNNGDSHNQNGNHYQKVFQGEQHHEKQQH